jgi:integrase
MGSSESILELNHLVANDYLLWMENYKINKKYGNKKIRISHLLDFLKFAKDTGEDDIIDCKEKYFCTFEGLSLSAEFSIHEFEDYYLDREIPLSIIDTNYIRNYIVNIDNASISTMIHRRAVLHKFLLFIDNSTNNNSFEETISKLKKYKKVKGDIYKSKTIDKKTIKRLLLFIDEFVNNPKLLNKRLKSNSVHTAYRNSAMILLMLGAGLRALEAISLRYCDIVDNNKDTYTIHVISGKGNKNRTTYIKKKLFKKHFEYLSEHKNNEKDPLSLNSKGSKIDRGNLYKFTQNVFKYLGVEQQGLHIFRHHFGSKFAENNGNIKILQDLLGHSIITTTMVYSSTGEDAKEDAIAMV